MISITLNYHSGLDPTNETATPKLRNVLLENLEFSGNDEGGEFDGLPESYIENITLKNVNFNNGKAKFPKCDYIKNGICDENVNPCPPCFKKKEDLNIE